jgi:response regulator of citrate/malate metabolism
LAISLVGGTAVDESRLAAATSAVTDSVRFRVLAGSLAAVEELDREAGSRLQQLVIVDMALHGWEAIVTALQTKRYAGLREIAVLVGDAEMWRLSEAWRLGVRGFLLRPVSAEHVALLASHLHLAWPRR